MTRNEKVLAGVLGVAVGGYALRGPVMALTVDPVRELEATRAAKIEEDAALSDRKFELMLAKQRVDAARARSLPADVSDAARLYPQWLGDLAALSGFGEVTTTVQTVSGRRGELFRPVRVTLKGLARTEELDAFLRRFAKTDLLHRVNRAVVDSPSATGDVDLSVEIEAEAVSLPTATDRNALFPLAELADPLPAGVTAATVTIPDDPALRFPAEAPFLVRAGRELLTVTAAEPVGDGHTTWTVERAADGTGAADHAAGAFLQLWPRAEPGGERLALSETGPFRKPRTYEPRLTVDGQTRLVRGDDFTLTATTADFDERAGTPELAVENAPAGLTLDPATGTLTWDPPADLAAGEYLVTVTAAVPKPETTLSRDLTLTLAEKNTPPTLAPVPSQTVQAGDVLLFEVAADDAEDPAGVTLSLQNPPAGAMVDADAGVVRWAVPEDADLGSQTLTVRATDGGDPPLTSDLSVSVDVREDLRPFVKFVGSRAYYAPGGDEPEPVADLYDQANDRTAAVRPGDAFNLGEVRGVVREIGMRTLTIERNDRLLTLEVGQSIAQARDVGPANPDGDGETENGGELEAGADPGEMSPGEPAG